MRIPGIVDVYAVGNEWVARSWPKVQNQPNSAAQLLWRKKFKDAHALIKTWQGVYLEAWRAISLPPDKMWIDIAMHSILSNENTWPSTPTQEKIKFELYYEPDISKVSPDIYGINWPENYCLIFNAAAQTYFQGPAAYVPKYGGDWQSSMLWSDLGWICPKGKRPKKKWSITPISEQNQPGSSSPVLIDGEWCRFRWQFFNHRGVTEVGLLNWPDSPTQEKGYALVGPPLHRKPKRWPGFFVP